MLDCSWFWDNPLTGHYLVSVIDGLAQIRFDLYLLRLSC